ncbi:hypothetical protein [Kibdelosporangium aridum]|uniref:hypothetical protein n=1 Tax=Kibdelosporangium aridum TaxID=2030 RepID=UPI0035EA700E
MMEPLSLRDFEALARDRLPRYAYDYVAGGADDEVTVRGERDGVRPVSAAAKGVARACRT